MKIHGLTCCVGYADQLRRSVDLWLCGLDTLTVVTDTKDGATWDLVMARPDRAACVRTDRFYERGAFFNKGSALEYALGFMPWSDWWLFFDADVVPPWDWKTQIEDATPEPGYLYGCRREQWTGEGQPTKPFPPEEVCMGYFQLFSTQDEAVARREPTLLDVDWKHGGGYDNSFADRWQRRRRVLPFRLIHIGDRDHWCGLGHEVEMEQMRAERQRRGARWNHGAARQGPEWDHERIR